MFYKILDDYIELYKLNGRNALDNMKSHYDCEEEYWAIIEELLDRYIELQSKIDKAYAYLDKFVPNEYGVLLTERQWEYTKSILKENR